MLAGNIPGRTQTIPMAIYFAVEGGNLQEAWLWSLTILGISLFGLTAVNLWWRRRGQRKTRRRGRLGNRRREGVFYLLQSETKEKLFPATHPLPHSPTQRQAPSTTAPILFVEIQKQLPDFSLNVSFTTDNRALGLLGASGAGKSLILRCIAGIETPDSGRIVLNGRVLFDSERGN